MFAKLTRHWRNWGVSNRLDIALSTFRSMGLFLGGSTWEVNTYLPAALMIPSLWQKSLFISKADGRPSLSMSSMTTGSLQDHSLNLRPAIMANRSDSAGVEHFGLSHKSLRHHQHTWICLRCLLLQENLRSVSLHGPVWRTCWEQNGEAVFPNNKKNHVEIHARQARETCDTGGLCLAA